MANSLMTETKYQDRHVRVAKLVCLSDDADGTLSDTTSLMDGCFLERVAVVPATGADAPSGAFDLTIKTSVAQGAKDILGSQGASLSETTPTDIHPYVGGTPAIVGRFPVYGDLTIALASMGNANTVTIWLIGSLFS